MSEFLMRGRGPLLDEDPGGSGTPVTGGTQGAASPEQIAEIVKTVLLQTQSSIDGAITSRLGSREALRDLQGLPEAFQKLADQIKPAASTNGKPASDGTGKPTMTAQAQVQEQMANLQKENESLKLGLHRGALNTQLRNALSASGVSDKVPNGATVSPLQSALTELMVSSDHFKSATDAHGNTTWSGNVVNEIGGTVPGSLDDSVKQFVAARAHYQPPIGSDGSGAGGGTNINGATPGVADKPLSELTREDVAKASDKEKEALWTAHGGQVERAKQPGFWGP